MFNDTSEKLMRWANDALSGETVRLGMPPVPATGQGIAFRLLDITPHAAPEPQRYRRLHATLRYLAMTWADEPATAHDLLGRLTVAVMKGSPIALEREPPSLALWQALGLPPQPGLLLRCEAYHDLPAPHAPTTRRTIFATTSSLYLNGRVVGADGRAVEQATVLVPRYDMRTQTDEGGRFQLPAPPSRDPVDLVVHANGRQEQIALVQSGGRAAGVVIQLSA